MCSAEKYNVEIKDNDVRTNKKAVVSHGNRAMSRVISVIYLPCTPPRSTWSFAMIILQQIGDSLPLVAKTMVANLSFYCFYKIQTIHGYQRHTDRQTDRQIDKQTDRQTG